MIEGVALAPLTTFKAGGAARSFAIISSEEELKTAAGLRRGLPIAVLGGGSNLLIPDEGIDGLVLKIEIRGIHAEEMSDGKVRLTSGAGESWDDVVEYAAARSWWGIENLAGIPGTLGGAVVQNIGAYGAELSQVFQSAEGVDLKTGEPFVINASEAVLEYRTSIFKQRRGLCITRAALLLSNRGAPNLSYTDLARAREEGESLFTPAEVGQAVRRIRASKFPSMEKEGTAGSFFRNPIISKEEAARLKKAFPGLPQFSQTEGVKIPLAWLLDHAFGMKGYRRGKARLFEKQPLVVVAEPGAPAAEIDALAEEIAQRVYDATGIKIEREVETFAAHEI